MRGVVAYLNHKDIPGENNAVMGGKFTEQIFTSKKVRWLRNGYILKKVEPCAFLQVILLPLVRCIFFKKKIFDPTSV